MEVDALSPTERSVLRAGADAVGAGIDDEFEGRIAVYLHLLGVWGVRLRLTGRRDRPMLLRKHVIDSLALAALLPPQGTVIDVGSGAGFPGIVIACLRPDLHVVLVEARRRKASFLGDVVRTVGLGRVRVANARAEDLAASASLVVSRAVRLETFLPLAVPLAGPGGLIVAMQTPARRDAARTAGSACGLRLDMVREYRLPDGEARALFVYRR